MGTTNNNYDVTNYECLKIDDTEYWHRESADDLISLANYCLDRIETRNCPHDE